MKTITKIISFISLGLILVSSILVFQEKMAWQVYANLSLGATAVWFITAPLWMKLQKK